MSDREPLPTIANPEPDEPRPAHRVRELAYALDVHPVTIYQRIAAGEIPAKRIGGVLRITDPVFRRLTGDDAGAAA